MYAHFWNLILRAQELWKHCKDCYLHFWKNKRKFKKNCSEKLTVKLRWYVGMFRSLVAYTDFLSEEIRLSLTIGFLAWCISMFWKGWHHWKACIADMSHTPITVQFCACLKQKIKGYNPFLEIGVQALLSIIVKE